MIRTLEEIRAGSVTVTVTIDSEPSTGSLSERLYSADEVGDAQTSEAELVSAPLRRQIAELTDALTRAKSVGERHMERNVELAEQLAGANQHATAARKRADRLEDELSVAVSKAYAFNQDRKSERDRADRQSERNKELAARLQSRIKELEEWGEKLSERNAELEQKLAEYQSAHVCIDSCKPNSHVAFVGRKRVTELGAQLANEIERAEPRLGRAD